MLAAGWYCATLKATHQGTRILETVTAVWERKGGRAAGKRGVHGLGQQVRCSFDAVVHALPDDMEQRVWSRNYLALLDDVQCAVMAPLQSTCPLSWPGARLKAREFIQHVG